MRELLTKISDKMIGSPRLVADNQIRQTIPGGASGSMSDENSDKVALQILSVLFEQGNPDLMRCEEELRVGMSRAKRSQANLRTSSHRGTFESKWDQFWRRNRFRKVP
jgi:hypothetical protein